MAERGSIEWLNGVLAQPGFDPYSEEGQALLNNLPRDSAAFKQIMLMQQRQNAVTPGSAAGWQNQTTAGPNEAQNAAIADQRWKTLDSQSRQFEDSERNSERMMQMQFLAGVLGGAAGGYFNGAGGAGYAAGAGGEGALSAAEFAANAGPSGYVAGAGGEGALSAAEFAANAGVGAPSTGSGVFHTLSPATGESWVGADEFGANAGIGQGLQAAPTGESWISPAEYSANAGAQTNFTPQAPGTFLGPTGGAGMATQAASASALQRVLAGNGTAEDFASLGLRALPGLIGAYAANQQAGQYKTLANEFAAYGAPYRERLSALYRDPSSFLSSPEVQKPVQMASDIMARSLSTTGNPVGSGNAQQQLQSYSADQLFGRLGQEKDRLAGFGGLSAYNAAAPAAASNVIQSNGNTANALGAAASNVFNPPKTMAEQLAAFKTLSG